MIHRVQRLRTTQSPTHQVKSLVDFVAVLIINDYVAQCSHGFDAAKVLVMRIYLSRLLSSLNDRKTIFSDRK